MKYQYNFLDEISVDLFAGGGGASTGYEHATGRIIDIAINHDPKAIGMHEMNHPFTKHYCENIFKVDPIEATQGRPVGFLWASPDCTHFSKAKGGKPVKKEIRSLAWIILQWASKVRPRVIMLENVPEFKTWGPISKDGKPIKERKGETFNQFIGHLRNLGYAVEWRDLVASHYGAATSRKRLYLIARCDGEPIVFPAPTHGKGLKKEVPASDFIDFSARGKSIFNRKKPLAIATQKRIAKGLDKFTIKNKKPFIVPVGYGEAPGQSPRVNDIDNPLGTIVASMIKHNFVEPKVKPFLMECNHGGERNGKSINNPLHTVTQKDTTAIIAPHIQKYFSGEHQAGSAIDKPVDIITAIDHNALANTIFSPFLNSCYGDRGDSNDRTESLEKPHSTITSGGRKSMLIAPHLVQYHAETSSDEVRAYGLDEPCKVIDTNPRYGLSTANLVQYYSTGKAVDIEKPLPTSTTKDRMAYVENHLCVLRNNMDCKPIDEPLPTVTTSAGHFAHIKTYLVKYSPGADLWNWPQVRKLLNDFAGYSIADDEVLILEINGVQHFIGDIEMRMLLPRELYGCQSFPADYIIDRISDGSKLPVHEQVKKVGNSVCPVMSKVLVAANCKWLIRCKEPIHTMAELYKVVGQ